MSGHLQRKQPTSVKTSNYAKSQFFNSIIKKPFNPFAKSRKLGSALVLAMLLCTNTFSQQQIGIKTGFVRSTIADGYDNSFMHYSWVSGYQIGATAGTQLSSNFSLHTSLQFTQKGYKAVQGSAGVPFYWHRNARFTYLELPADLRYSINTKKNRKVFIGSGLVPSVFAFGSIEYAISSSDGSGNVYNTTGESKRPFQNSKKFDLGVNMLAGVELKNIQLQLTYNYGLSDLSSKTHNRSIALSLAYLLKK